MVTFQDFEQAKNKGLFIEVALNEHTRTEDYKTAQIAKQYDRKESVTMKTFQRYVYDAAGHKHVDFLAANNKITSNFFNLIMTQKVQYLLGNGAIFENDAVPDTFKNLDGDLQKLGRLALVTGCAYGYFDGLTIHAYDVCNFIPLFDEETGALRAGVHFYQLDSEKPLFAYLFEEDGLSKYRKAGKDTFKLCDDKKPYKTTLTYTDAGGIVSATTENYSTIPVVQLPNQNRLSELVGRRSQIDAYDLTISGLLNDIDETAFSYWLISNASGMDTVDIQMFMENLKRTHVAKVDADEQVASHQQDVPVEARKTSLEVLEDSIYRDFSELNYRSLSTSGVTATAINAAYKPVDDSASQLEYMIIEFLQAILALIGAEKEKFHFERQKLENRLENAQVDQIKVNTVKSLDTELDTATILETVKKIMPELSEIDVSAVMLARDDESGAMLDLPAFAEGGDE